MGMTLRAVFRVAGGAAEVRAHRAAELSSGWRVKGLAGARRGAEGLGRFTRERARRGIIESIGGSELGRAGCGGERYGADEGFRSGGSRERGALVAMGEESGGQGCGESWGELGRVGESWGELGRVGEGWGGWGGVGAGGVGGVGGSGGGRGGEGWGELGRVGESWGELERVGES